jgi:cytochrome P450
MVDFSATPVTKIDSGGGRCVYAQMEAFRAAGPAVPVELPEGMGAWSVSRGDVVRRLLTHPGVSRNVTRNVPSYEPGSIAWLSPWVDVASMSTAEGRDHQRLRRLVAPALTPKRIDAMRPRLVAIAERLLDALANRPGDEPVDLHTAYSQQLPTRMICDLFGVPDDLRGEVLRILRVVLNTENVPEEESAGRLHRHERGHAHPDRAAAPRAGGRPHHVPARGPARGQEPLSEQELVDMLLLLIGGGSQTTVSLIDHTVRELLAHPDQLSALRADPGRWPEAVEESLRVHCPVGSLPMRWATEDIDLGEGVVLRAGDAILINYLAHGRGPRRTRPARDVRHRPGRQGAPGVRLGTALLPRRPARPVGGRRRRARALRSLPVPGHGRCAGRGRAAAFLHRQRHRLPPGAARAPCRRRVRRGGGGPER